MNSNPLRRYWNQRAPRERALLACGVAFTGTALMFLTVIAPAFTAIGRLQQSLPLVQARSAQLEAILSEVRALKSRPAIGAGTEVSAALEQSLAVAGLKPVRAAVRQSDGAYQLNFADVPYGAWSVWLMDAERSFGLRATVVAAHASSTAGNVDVGVTIRSGHE